jgi:hypothetical protein
MPFGITEVNYALKKIYPKYPPQNVASFKHPYMSNTTKEDGWYGEENMKQGLEHTNPQAIGGDFTKAKAVSSSTQGVSFDVPRRWKYGFAKIHGKAIVATTNNEGAFFRAVKKETDNGIRAFGDRLATEMMCGDGSGVIGIVAVLPGGNVVTLGKKWHARRFKLGMAVEASTAGTIATLRSGTMLVTKVNFTTGQITFGGGLIAGLSVNDFLAASGDTEVGIHGVAAYIPLADPGGADSFFGVNRSAQPTLLAGHRLDSTAKSNSIKENAMDLGAIMSTTGASPDAGYASPVNWNRLGKDLDAQVKVDAGEGKFGFPYIEQMLPSGMVKWYADPDCEDDRCYLLSTAAWKLRHAYGFPHLNEDDGNPALRDPDDDAVQVRLRSAGNLFCLAPSDNGVFETTPPA